MARLARLYAPQTCQLVQVRLLPQTAVHMEDLNPLLLQWLKQAVSRYQLAIHAWSLTEQDILILATPAHERAVSQVIQALGRNIAAHLHQGAVFKGRYRSCLVQNGEHVLASMIWLESYVHQQQGVEHPEWLPWSSAGGHTGVQFQDLGWLRDHAAYWYLGNTPFERQARYRELCQEGLSATMLERVQAALQGQWVLGDAAFIEAMSTVANRRVAPSLRGRPKKVREVTAASTAMS